MLRNLSLVARSALHSPQTAARPFSAQSDFEQAQKNLDKLKEDPGNDVKLQLYALFKQATLGDVQGKRPGMLDIVGRTKYDAWHGLKGQTQDEARANYANVVKGLVAEDVANASETAGTTVDGLKAVDGLNITREGKVFKITLNRPKKFNALTFDMYGAIQNALDLASKDKTTSITVIAANGPYFSAGNDLTNFEAASGGDREKVEEMAKVAKVVLHEYVDAYIRHEKPLIGLVNGPAVGIAVTVLGLFDYVIASDRATFHTPFAPLGQSPEGCSSYTFPLLMGPLKASELLLFCKKISAETAKSYGLVNEVVPLQEFHAHTQKTIEEFSEIPPESLSINKTHMRSLHREKLFEINNVECDLIATRWLSKECHDAVTAFIARSAQK
uniref:ACB domain-containing protein n=2 Tax=Caenorhabditis japonica TaxID=281687 RepID=A0A8R1I0W6_CAEJA